MRTGPEVQRKDARLKLDRASAAWRLVVALLVLQVVFAQPSFSAGGAPDTTFGGDGRVTTNFASGAVANAVAIQPDGKIVAAGATNDGRFALARYNADGTLDTSFGGNGRVRTRFEAAGSTARAVAIQPDGKIVAAGDTEDQRRFAIARYHANGSIDRTFSRNGRVITRFLTGGNFARALALQPDGKIVVVGQTNGNAGSAAAVARYLPHGRLDPSFGGDGKVTTRFVGSVGDAYGVTVQRNGRIIVVGEGLAAGGFCLARYLPDGRLDRTFGADGTGIVVTLPMGGARAVALQEDGRIVVAGIGGDIFGPFAVARYTQEGRRDRTFGERGFVTVRMGSGEESGDAVAIQSDGKIVEVGYTNVPHEFGDTGKGAFAVARFRKGGKLDKSFSGDGKVLTKFEEGLTLGRSVALQRSGKIVVAGWAGSRFGLARYRSS